MQAIELGHRDSLDATAVGHKAANLARFAASFRVPPAFCLSTTVYDELKLALEPRGAIERDVLRRCVEDAYARLSATIRTVDPRVAVRSSATGEDSADASFAGQHETILNVSGTDDVVEAVLECWRSAGNDRVTAYRREKGIDAPVHVAVLVQQMVDADVSAIAFGVDPVSGDHEVVVIDAAHGLGDKIASGDITPDRYTVRKSDLVVTGPTRGALDDGAAREIAKLTLALERENEHPVDVECAFAKGELYLLQCRPITTLARAFPVAWRHPDDAKLHWRRDDAHGGEPVPRLCTDYNEYGPNRGLQRRAVLYDLPLSPRLEAFCGRIYTTAVRRVPTGDLAELGRSGLLRVRADARIARRRWDEEQLPALRAHYAWFEERTAAIASASPAELERIWNEAWITRFGEIWLIHMVAVWAAFAIGDELAELYEKLTGGATLDALKLTQGRAQSLQRLERDLHALAKLRASGDERALKDAIAAFLASPHGNLGNSGEDLRSAVWREEPSLLLAELDRRSSTPGEHPDARHARLVAEGDAVEARVREALRDRPADLAHFEEVLATARAVAPITEEHNYHLDRQIQSYTRRLIHAFGARLVADGRLDAKEDIFYFHVAEIAAALRDTRPLHELARSRANEYAGWRRLRHPKTLGAPPGPLHTISTRTDLNYRRPQADEGLVTGAPASGGVRRGRVCIVRGAKDFPKMKAGSVLVCRSSNVSWVPLFTIAAAVVTDVGGALSHAAVVAREFGVPAVVGCGVAFERLRDGQLVEVNGDLGTVRPLD
jgi:phosphohistidine swiveling domain-containing protein